VTDQDVRDALYAISGMLPGEALQGYAFGFGLIASDHVFRILEKVMN
jgi:hypothetical protein